MLKTFLSFAVRIWLQSILIIGINMLNTLNRIQGGKQDAGYGNNLTLELVKLIPDKQFLLPVAVERFYWFRN